MCTILLTENNQRFVVLLYSICLLSFFFWFPFFSFNQLFSHQMLKFIRVKFYLKVVYTFFLVGLFCVGF